MTESTTSSPEYQKRDRSKKPLILTIAIVAIAAVIAAAIFWFNRGESGVKGPAEGGSQELTVGLQLQPTNLDIRATGGVALDQILIDNVYQGLVGLGSKGLDDFVPVLAEKLPEVSDDGLKYTFTLREGVKFHSGNALTAADVVDSLSAAEGPASLTAAIGAPVKVTSPDEQTVVIELETPNSQLLWHLANRPGLVFETAFAGDLASETNGTGPFTLAQWKEGDSITFAANPDYWGDAPSLAKVVWAYIPDPNAAVNAALAGELDVLAPVQPSMVSQLDGKGFNLVRADSTDVFTLGYNVQNPKLADVRVRAALSKAIDSEAIVKAFYGDGKALGGPITDIEPAYEDLTQINGYDPEGAKQLLAEAGVSGLELTVTFPNHYATDAINQVVTQFAEIGVKLTVDSVEFPTWLNDVYKTHNYDLSYVNHVEPNDFSNYVNPAYYFGYESAEAQALYAQAISAADPAEAVSLTKQAARVVANDAPAKWLINYTPTNAIGEQVQGFPQSNTNSRIKLEGVSVK